MLFDARCKGVHIHVYGISVNVLAHKSTQLILLFCGTLKNISLQNVVAAGPPPIDTFTVRFLGLRTYETTPNLQFK